MVRFKGLEPQIEKFTLAILNDTQLEQLEQYWIEKIVNPFASKREIILQDINNLEVTPWAGTFHYGSAIKRSALMKKYGNVERPKRTTEEIQLTVKKAKLSQIHKAYKTTGLFNEKELEQLGIDNLNQALVLKKEAHKNEIYARELFLEVSMLPEGSAIAKFLKSELLSDMSIEFLEHSPNGMPKTYSQPKKFKSISELLESRAQNLITKEKNVFHIIEIALATAEKDLKKLQTNAHSNANDYNKKVKKFYLTGMPDHRSMNDTPPIEFQKFYNLPLM